jgi:UDP-galactopyranose mutase
MYDFLIVGCGLSGCVMAERLANVSNKKSLIIDKRDHIGGNCYDYIDKDTNILMNKYGAHLFHTKDKEVWEYINKFDEWERWEHKVLSLVKKKFVSMPVNITTINELLNETLENESDVNEWLLKNQEKYDEIKNSEEMACSRIGRELFNLLVKDYTIKQWNKEPKDLKPEVLARIPIRNNFDTRYFNDKYQALPKYGYTHFFEKLIDNPLINLKLNTDFFDFKSSEEFSKLMNPNFKIIYTGPIDHYFSNYNYPKLEYRSIDFKIEKIKNMNYYQPNSVVNYPELNVDFTRIVEYKHFLNQESNDTVIVYETTNDKGDPYYPVLNDKNLELYKEYQKLALQEEEKGVYFLGRLANYKYFNMDQAIKNALIFFNKINN